MKKLHLTHKVFTASVVGAVTVTTSVAAVFAYQAVTQYKPSSSKEEMKNNQVLFNNNKNSLENNSKNEQNSKWLEKQDQKNKQNATQNSNYLFDKNQEVAIQKTMTINTQTTSSNTENANQSTKSENSNTVTDSDNNTVVDVDKNAKNPDIIIDDKNNGTSGEDNTGKGDNSGSGTIDPALPDSNHKPTPSPGDNTNPGGNKPSTKIDYDKVKDPVSTKKDVNKNFFSYSDVEIKDYSADKVEESKKDKDSNVKILIQPANDFEFQLCQGQTITKTSLFNMMLTGVYITDSKGNSSFYTWNENELGKYIRINGISVDGGKTWIKDFPYTIDKGVTNIKIDISYRLSKDDQWTDYKPDNSYLDTFEVSDTKVMVLKRKVNVNNDSLDITDIANSSSQYLEVGTKLDLLYYQTSILSIINEGIFNENEELNYLFSGWTENGKDVGWVYEVSEGRHFLIPNDLIKLDSKYTAKIKYVDIMIEGDMKYDGLQTLTRTTEKENLIVPKYIQMVDFENEQTLDAIKLPDTVMMVRDKNLNVGEWKVSENNPYLVVKDGILMSKDLTEIISVPKSVNDVEISEKVDKISAQNLSGKTIVLKTSDLDKLPEISYSKLKNCKFVLNDSLFDSYISNNYDSIVQGENITFAKASNPNEEYTVKNHCIVQENTLYKAIKGVSTIHLDDNMDTIGKNAFKHVKGVKNLILNDSLVTLEDGCFDDSSIKHIYCSTLEQKEYLDKRLKELGYEDIEVSLEETEVNGFKYKIDEDGTITLLKAPSNITEFNGTVNNVQFDVIGDGAFKDCTSLQEVYLPENVKVIGEEAFENCSSLAMMLIDSRDSITIGNNAFEGLSSIRILASNAKSASMNGYSPNVYDQYGQNMFFSPSSGSGYENSMFFLGGYGAYTLENIGKNTQAIYLNTWDGTPFLMMSAPKVVDKEVVLPATTKEFYPYAMADTCAGSDLDPYTINLGDLQSVYYNTGAFYNSNISGDVTIGKDCYVDNFTFEWCQFIDTVTALDDVSIVSNAFSNCDNITKYKSINTDDLYKDAFAWCSNMNDIEFVGKIPNITGIPVSGSESIHIMLTDTFYTKEEFLKKYMYMFAGYTDSEGETASQAMWTDAKWDIVFSDEHIWDEELYNPTYDEVYEQFKAKLLEAENNLRTMLGMDSVEEPTWMPTDIPTKKDFGEEDEEDKKDDSETSDKDTEESKDTEDKNDNSSKVEDNPDENQNDETESSNEKETPSTDDTEGEISNTDGVVDDSTTPDVQSDTTQRQDIQENEEDFQ